MTKHSFKDDFPIFRNRPHTAYLDTAATSQTPASVIDAMTAYYERTRANVHRGLYALSAEASAAYDAARAELAAFVGASPEEIIFTSGTTHGLNLLAASLGRTLRTGDNIVLTRMEHHANLVPWQEARKRYGFDIRFIEMDGFRLDMASADAVIDAHTKIVSIAQASNALGTINPVAAIAAKAAAVGAVSIVDAAQSIAHMPTDVRALGCDFLVFSGHKMYGPTGIGVLYGTKDRLAALEPSSFGGDMIREVTFEKAVWAEAPVKFEAGTPNVSGAIGLGAAAAYIRALGWDAIQSHEAVLTASALEMLSTFPRVRVVGPEAGADRIGVISFVIDTVHPHDIASILDANGVAVRAGHHCAMPLIIEHLKLPGTARASFGIYTDDRDIHAWREGMEEIFRIFP
jgi:cysteine desulfurase/selenocysteine lyase